MKNNGKIKRWEMALVLAVCLTFGHALLPGSAAGCHWWGVIFPGLTDVQPAVQEASAFPDGRGGEGVILRLRLLDWLREIGIICGA